jgi:integrase
MIARMMPDLLAAFRAHLAGDRRATRTIHAYTKIVAAFLSTLSNAAPSARSVEEFLARPRRDGAERTVATRNQELAALRCLALVAVREGAWPANPTDRIKFAKRVRRYPAFLDENEVRQLFFAVERKPPAGERCSRSLGSCRRPASASTNSSGSTSDRSISPPARCSGFAARAAPSRMSSSTSRPPSSSPPGSGSVKHEHRPCSC